MLEQARARQLLEEPPLHGLRRQWAQLGAILQISAAAGVPLAALLDRLADAWEDGQDGHQARQAAAAGPRSTARLLALLPVAGIGLSVAAGAPPTQMLSTPAGWLVLGCGAVLAVVGTVWTRALVRRAEAE